MRNVYQNIFRLNIKKKNRCNCKKNKKGTIVEFWKTLIFRLDKEEQDKKVREQREKKTEKMRCDRGQESKTKEKLLEEESKKLCSILRHQSIN